LGGFIILPDVAVIKHRSTSSAIQTMKVNLSASWLGAIAISSHLTDWRQAADETLPAGSHSTGLSLELAAACCSPRIRVQGGCVELPARSRGRGHGRIATKGPCIAHDVC
jgi:hypothetical protein